MIFAALPIVDEWGTTVSYVMDTVKILVGGLFGLYVAEFFYRIVTFRRTKRQLNMISAEVKDLRKVVSRLEKKLIYKR